MSSRAISRVNSLIVVFSIAAGVAVAVSLGGADGTMAGFGAALATLLCGGWVTSSAPSARC